MKALILVAAAIGLIALSAGCNARPKSGRGLHLPDGSLEQGQKAFADLNCGQCHSVTGVPMKRPANASTNIVLGGTVVAIRTYGELVTSIINPTHGLKPGQVAVPNPLKMPEFNKTMTVQQMIDLVAFLQSRYELEPEPNLIK